MSTAYTTATINMASLSTKRTVDEFDPRARNVGGSTSAGSNQSQSPTSTSPQAAPAKKRRKQKYTRTKLGCLVCRSRKVRCDELKPSCQRCLDLDRDCQYDPATLELAAKAPPPEARTHAAVPPPAVLKREDSSTMSQRPDALLDMINSIEEEEIFTPGQMAAQGFRGQLQAIAPAPAPTWEATLGLRSESSQMAVTDARRTTSFSDASIIPWASPTTAPDTLSLSTSALASRRKRQPESVQTPQVTAPFLFNFAPTVTLEPFMHAFPSAAARHLFHHYISSTSRIVIALGNDDMSQNPILAVALPMVLLDTNSPACAALRLSLLSTAAAHLDHLQPGGQLVKTNDMNVLAQKMKKQAMGHLVMSLTRNGDDELDVILAVCVITLIRDVLSADRSWRENLEFAISLIQKRGGPAALLAEDPDNFTRRFILEQIAVHDAFGSFSTNAEPTLLGNWSPWWFDCEKTSKTAWQWESIERQFGISRGLCDVVARVLIVCSRKAKLGEVFYDQEMSSVAACIQTEAWTLIDELKIWAISQQDSPRKARVQFGDHAYRHALNAHLLIEVLDVPSSDPRVQSAAHCVLELCAEISTEPVMLVWPLLIAGSVVTADQRPWVKSLFRAFGYQYCQDLATAEKLLDGCWARIDDGLPRLPWPELMKQLRLDVLLI